MEYRSFKRGIFIDRPNRFIAHVEVDGIIETVHVKNTGRCKEILLPGTSVGLEYFENTSRKTKYDLISAYKDSAGWINIDSQLPNKLVKDYLQSLKEITFMKAEYTYGKSRVDFYFEKNNEKYLLEIKGCTLEIDGKGYFPDAPTERGRKHLLELTGAVSEGYHTAVGFVIQVNGVSSVAPYGEIDPAFEEAYLEAKNHGLETWFFLCDVTDRTISVHTVIKQ